VIQAEKWSQNDQSLDVRFDLSTILMKQGVYTIVMYFVDNRNSKFPGALYSIFVK